MSLSSRGRHLREVAADHGAVTRAAMIRRESTRVKSGTGHEAPTREVLPNGELRTAFESPRYRAGNTPGDLLPVMEEVWCDLDGEADFDVFDDKADLLAPAERLTSVRVTEELLSGTEYLLGHVREEPAWRPDRLGPGDGDMERALP
ncbi:DUF6461 domain-containing protein [Embleya sp. AB8]|uniref:DUF6461 domain-containing protein n=1 Tax=Embleya sp. AB8 TaxID=3156304 RepID=UPI003C778590